MNKVSGTELCDDQYSEYDFYSEKLLHFFQ